MNERPTPKGRGSGINPPSRFRRLVVEDDFEHLEHDPDLQAGPPKVRTEYFEDLSRSIVNCIDSPDVPYRFSLNPYRGCSHGCAYCYARPYHEYLDFNAGLDFETKIMVKLRAPGLLRDWLNRPDWEPQPIAFSGVTDCYQPAERKFQLTGGCLEVALEANQAISIVTKNALVTRDIDLLAAMAEKRLVRVALSITTLDGQLTKVMEPGTSSPQARLRTIRQLEEAGVPTMVMVAPVIPGLTDSELPAILQAAAEHGARSAGYILLRLPLTVEPVFTEWLQRTQPHLQEKILSRIRSTRKGELSQSDFGVRMRGEGEIADQIAQAFHVFRKRCGLDRELPEWNREDFRPPRSSSGQLRLF